MVGWRANLCYAKTFEYTDNSIDMSSSEVLAFPTKLDYYHTSSSGQYLCALLPVEARDIGIDEDTSVEWSLEVDSDADAWYLKGIRTTEDGRLVRSVQPGRGSAAEFKMAIPPEFYRSNERSPISGMEKGNEVILEIVKGDDPQFRIYQQSDYSGRQQAVSPQIKAPVVAGIGLSILDQSEDYSTLTEDIEGGHIIHVDLYTGPINSDNRAGGGTVTLGGLKKTATSRGTNAFSVSTGTYKIKAKYQNREASCAVKIDGATVIRIRLDNGTFIKEDRS